MKPLDMVRWGVIGCGDVVENKSGPPLVRTQGSELIAIASRSPEKASQAADRFGAKRWYTSAETLISDPEINAVYVASPHYLHRKHAVMAANAGKAVLCEKPMGVCLEDALEIASACAINGVWLTVAYYRRAWYITRALQRLLKERAIGQIVQARVQVSDRANPGAGGTWRDSKRLAGGGILADAGSHWIDLIHLLLGPIEQVTASCSPGLGSDMVERTLNAELRTHKGVPISLLLTKESPVFINDFEILGTEGRLLAGPYSEGQWLLQRPGKQPELVQFNHIGPAHTELIADVVQSLQAGGAAPVPGEAGVAVWRSIESIYEACAEGGRVKVPNELAEIA